MAEIAVDNEHKNEGMFESYEQDLNDRRNTNEERNVDDANFIYVVHKMFFVAKYTDAKNPGSKTDNISDIYMEESHMKTNRNPNADGCGNHFSPVHVHSKNSIGSLHSIYNNGSVEINNKNKNSYLAMITGTSPFHPVFTGNEHKTEISTDQRMVKEPIVNLWYTVPNSNTETTLIISYTTIPNGIIDTTLIYMYNEITNGVTETALNTGYVVQLLAWADPGRSDLLLGSV